LRPQFTCCGWISGNLKKYFVLADKGVILYPKQHCMLKRLVLVASIGVMLASCGGNSEKLQSQVDSLKTELQESQQFATTLQEVGVLMDSIDANRQLLRVNMVEGTTYENYKSRMKDINNYVKDTQNKITDLEKALKKSKGNTNSYLATIKKLKADLEERNKAIATLNEQVDLLKNENQNLITTVGLQEAELSDKESQIVAKQQELALIEARIQEMMVQSKMSEGDSYFARGQALEEAANRTKLAPRKKKETYREALELYKKALSLGNQASKEKITALEKKVK
jgi:chromosome segregation ATPase